MAKSSAAAAPKIVNREIAHQAFAKALFDGDIVNFRFLFGPFSPARTDSTERFETTKYAYLLPNSETASSPQFRSLVELVAAPANWSHIERELAAKRPPQLPADLLLKLADNAVRQGKYTSAAQAYETLRIRKHMQDEFRAQGEHLLDSGDIEAAVRAFTIAVALTFNYAAFPEPLPAVANYQSRALLLHAELPAKPEDSIALRPLEMFLRDAVSYLLLDPEIAGHVATRSVDVQVAFLRALVLQVDPDWNSFVGRYREACAMAEQLGDRLKQWAAKSKTEMPSLREEIAAQVGEDPHRIAEHLLGRAVEPGEWWQYIKELAYSHPASVLFVARHPLGETELIVPRYRENSAVVRALGLVAETKDSGYST